MQETSLISPELLSFVEGWHNAMFILAPGSLVLSLLIYIGYKLKYVSLKEFKQKYDFVSKYELRFFMASHFAIAAAIFFICNTYSVETVKLSFVWFFIRLFICICIATLYGYVANLILQYYYPSKQHDKLHKLRYISRINPKTGNVMKLLSEEEEDAYLDEGMQAEEDVFSVDYDVWIDTETGDTRIEKYEGRLSAMKCDRCGFQTLKLEKEEIVQEATEFEDGEILKHYKCTYCKRIKRKNVRLSKTKSESDFKITDATKFVEDPLGYGTRVVTIKVEIHSNRGDVKNYEFQNLREAQKFLKEFDFSKLEEEEEV